MNRHFKNIQSTLQLSSHNLYIPSIFKDATSCQSLEVYVSADSGWPRGQSAYNKDGQRVSTSSHCT